ncbi:MAG: hypothetical protein QNJ92_09330 [Alphaproteobacteria bacterium]|nr:hypothetical protein [Alphaproteobacteria bacterium]
MFDIEAFVEDCKRARREDDSHKAIQEVVARAVSEPGALIRSVGQPTQAGLHTLYNAPDLTILNVVWAPLMTLMPHNHEMWAVIGIYTGREDNIFWRRVGSTIEAAGAKSLAERDAAPLGHDVIHSVTNPIERCTGAIHVYGGDFFAPGRSEWSPETLDERPYNVDNARRLFEEANRRFAA